MSALPQPPSSQTAFDPATLRWTNRHAAMGASHGRRQAAQPVPQPHWIATSAAAAADLGWPTDWWQHPDALAVHAGAAAWPGSAPMATVYSGHQFGVWAGQLGDGRALLLGELETPNGPREVQLKGSGLTPYSRMGDGRAVLRSSIREYLCSEAMHGLGIPTTRALALIGSPLPVRREGLETAAVVTRTAPSFIRFGHFEHFAHHDQPAALRQLFDHVVDGYFPACREARHPAAALLTAVAERTADLVAQWQAVGFCHGVMNTDNLSILGLTIDYGPFGFLDGYDPGHICNHSDHQGRYAYARQPQVAYWNLHALAQALVPLVDAPEAELAEILGAALEGYRERFPQQMGERMRAKLGLLDARDEDRELVEDLQTLMAATRVDHTLFWRQLAELVADGTPGLGLGPARDLFLDRPAFDAWAERYRARLRAEGSVGDGSDRERHARMNRVNPRFVLRNHLAETAIRAAREGDFSEVVRLAGVLERPYDEQPEHAAYAALPPDWAQTLEVSCSS